MADTWKTSWDTELKRLYTQGVFIKDLKAHFGVSKDTIYRHVDRLGLGRRPPPNKKAVCREEIKDRLILNQSLRQIKNEMGLSWDRAVAEVRADKHILHIYQANLKRRGVKPRWKNHGTETPK